MLWVWLCGCLMAGAQNNPYKINDELYKLFLEINKVRNDSVVLQMGQHMRQEAQRLGDKKAECLSFAGAGAYYSQQKKVDPKAPAFFEEMRQVSRRNGFMQYCFLAYSNEAIMYLNNHRRPDAVHVYTAALNEATELNDAYGLSVAYQGMGNLYVASKMFQSAVLQYEKALEAIRKDTVQSPSSVLGRLASVNLNMENYEKSVAYALEGLKEAKVSSAKTRLLMTLVEDYYFLGKRKEFYDTWKEMEASVKENGVSKSTDLDKLTVLKLLMEDRLEEADALVKNKPDMDSQGVLRKEIAKKTGNWKAAYELEMKQHKHDLKEFEAESSTSMADYNVLLEQSEVERQNVELEKEQIRERGRYRKLLIYMLAGMLMLVLIGGGALVLSRNRRLRAAERGRKHTEEARQEAVKARQEAERANKAKSMFIQNMSHEVRTPLNAICGFSQLLSHPDYCETLTPEEKREYGMIIQNSTSLLTTLVNDILDLSDMESGKYRINKCDMRVNEVCLQTLKTVEHRALPGVTMEFSSEVDDNYTIFSDPTRVQQIVENYLTNAVKHTEQGSIKLHVSTSEVPGKLCISVTDTGEGVPADKAEAIFERFEKLDTLKQGTGLGLSICRALASCLDGKAYLDTQHQGPGARFVFQV